MTMANSKNDEVLNIIKNMMLFSGLWPKYHYTNFYYNIKTIISVIAPLIFTILMYHQIINNINYIDKVTDVLCVFFSFATYLIKFTIFFTKRDNFLITLRQLQNETFVNYPKEFDHYVDGVIKFSKYIARLYQFSCSTVVITYYLKPLIVTDGQRLPLDVAFDVGKYYYFIYVFQAFSLVAGAYNNSAIDALTVDLMMIAGAQLDILKDKLLTLNVYAKDNVQNNTILTRFIEYRIKNCVNHHLDIIRYVILITGASSSFNRLIICFKLREEYRKYILV